MLLDDIARTSDDALNSIHGSWMCVSMTTTRRAMFGCACHGRGGQRARGLPSELLGYGVYGPAHLEVTYMKSCCWCCNGQIGVGRAGWFWSEIRPRRWPGTFEFPPLVCVEGGGATSVSRSK